MTQDVTNYWNCHSRSVALDSESKRYAVFTDTEFLCDETSTASRNREVVPTTKRNESPCCPPGENEKYLNVEVVTPIHI